MPSPEEVKADVARQAEASDFVERLAERIGLSARASAVFGEPVARDAVTVIPVARAVWGFGGGGGAEWEKQGSGGGGASMVLPYGFIEVRDGDARFVPLRHPLHTATLVAASLGAYAMLLRARHRRR